MVTMCRVLKSLGLVVDIKNWFSSKVEEWCETTGQKECASSGNKGTEKRRKFQVEEKVGIILALSLGEVWRLLSIPNTLFVHRMLP